jgi:hypothetical protein
MASALAPRGALPSLPSSDDAVTAAAASAMGDLDITTAVVPLDGEGDDGWRERESWKGGALAPLP